MRLDWNPTNYQFAWEVVGQYRGWLFEGVILTLKIALVSMAFAMVLGLVVALLRMSPVSTSKPFGPASSAYRCSTRPGCPRSTAQGCRLSTRDKGKRPSLPG